MYIYDIFTVNLVWGPLRFAWMKIDIKYILKYSYHCSVLLAWDGLTFLVPFKR